MIFNYISILHVVKLNLKATKNWKKKEKTILVKNYSNNTNKN